MSTLTLTEDALGDTPIDVIKAIRNFDKFAELPAAVVNRVLVQVSWILRHQDSPKSARADITAAAAKALRCSEGSFLRYKLKFEKRNWKGLTDGRKSGVTSRGLPPRFKSYVAGKFDPHQRDKDDIKEVWRSLLDDWNLWRQTNDPKYAIAGYTFPPKPDPSTGHPVGWSYDNIARLRPNVVERALAKHGQKSAAAFLPPVLTTRVGSGIMSRLLFDDQDLDNLLADGFMAIAGIETTSRPVSFNALDFYTGRHLDHHLRMLYKEPDKAKSKALTGMEFCWFVIKQLQTHGWRNDSLGTELIFEHGTANTWANKQLTSLGGHHAWHDAIEAITGGRAFVNRSGKYEGAVFAELCFRAQSTGNFKFKTWIESAFRLVRTYMQALPGPIGSNQRINGKDETYGIKLASNAMLSAIASCPDRAIQEFIVENMKLELLDLPTFAQLVNSVYHAINRATVHNLKDWQRCGFTVPLIRFNDQSEHWFAASELEQLAPDPLERQMLLRRVNANKDTLTKLDYMSRDEAWMLSMARDRDILTKLTDPMVGMLLPIEWAHRVTLASNHTFTLANPLWKDSRDLYVASWKDERGGRITLDGGGQFLVFANPFSEGRAQLYSLDGSYVTTLFPEVAATPWDTTRKLEALKVRSEIKSGHEAHLRARMLEVGKHRTENEKINRGLIDLTRDDRRRRKNAEQAESSAKGKRTAATNAEAADEAIAAVVPPSNDHHTDDLDF